MTTTTFIPSVSVRYAGNGASTQPNMMGMRVMQERAYQNYRFDSPAKLLQSFKYEQDGF